MMKAKGRSAASRLILIPALAAVLVGTAACSTSPDSPAPSADGDLVIEGDLIATEQQLEDSSAAGNKIVIYGGNVPEITQPWYDRFTEETGIAIEYVQLIGAALVERVLAEDSTGRLGADVVFTADQVGVASFAENGILEAYEVANVDDLPNWASVADDHAWLHEVSFNIIAFNSELVKGDDIPSKWSDLTDPKYSSDGGLAIGLNPPERSTSYWATQYTLRDRYGLDFWKDLAAVQPKIYPSSTPMSEDLARGEIAIYVGARQAVQNVMNQGAPVKMVFPEDFGVAFPNMVGKFAGAENPAGAEIFLNWSVAKSGASAMVDIIGDWSPNPAAGPPALENVVGEIPTEAPDTMTDEDQRNESLVLRETWVPEWASIFGYTPS